MVLDEPNQQVPGPCPAGWAPPPPCPSLWNSFARFVWNEFDTDEDAEDSDHASNLEEGEVEDDETEEGEVASDSTSNHQNET